MEHRNPVLHYLAVVRAARDFGVEPKRLDELTLRFSEPAALADAVADALLERS
jgi:hypothetical protein